MFALLVGSLLSSAAEQEKYIVLKTAHAGASIRIERDSCMCVMQTTFGDDNNGSLGAGNAVPFVSLYNPVERGEMGEIGMVHGPGLCRPPRRISRLRAAPAPAP